MNEVTSLRAQVSIFVNYRALIHNESLKYFDLKILSAQEGKELGEILVYKFEEGFICCCSSIHEVFHVALALEAWSGVAETLKMPCASAK